MLPLASMMGGGMSLDMGSSGFADGASNAHSNFNTGAFAVGGGNAASGEASVLQSWMPVILIVAAIVALGIVGRRFT
ncbi:MAG: hypothetical protein Q7V31_16035 [Parvibaculum sp.]|uniref:hypothetical protein n=1 Tax=Parvibaculum sp. TaxID=2024848 RepID=UPI002715AB03|nr:hypothetical protein [Parvibaculum sp.]MDO8840423.1 hypothetical protein [Parvibaculum sp.]